MTTHVGRTFVIYQENLETTRNAMPDNPSKAEHIADMMTKREVGPAEWQAFRDRQHGPHPLHHGSRSVRREMLRRSST